MKLSFLHLSRFTLVVVLAFFNSACLLAQINLSISKENLKCNGDSSGHATVNISGGTPPYSVNWSNGATTQTITHLAAATYNVTVQDAAGSLATGLAAIQQPPVLHINVFGQNQICDQAPDGQASAVPSGGTPPYTYLWSSGQPYPSIGYLSEGTYTISVTDSKGCTSKDSVHISNAHEGLWTMLSITPALCQYASGGAHISIMSGTPPYQYHWSTGATTETLENVQMGSYSVSVTDFKGCATTVNVNVNTRNMDLAAISTVVTCGYTDGTATVYSLEGVSPYQYAWSNGGTLQTISDLAEGLYTATVTDANGCSGVKSQPVTSDGALPIAYLSLGYKCFNQIASFVGNPPPLYPEIQWKLDDPSDDIVSGQGTDTVRIKWNSTGLKYVTAFYGHNGEYCRGDGFRFPVAVCAASTEAGLEGVSIGPNPFGEHLQIIVPVDFPDDKLEASLYNIAGELLLNLALEGKSPDIPTASFPPGFYLLKIKSPKSEKTWKLAKQ